MKMEKYDLESFVGNRLTNAERKYRLERLAIETQLDVDDEIMPYLKQINKHDWIVTTQSCCGHNEDNGRTAHIDFRCKKAPEWVIDNLLRPMDVIHNVNIRLCLECNRLRYLMWLDNEKWRVQLDFFIGLLDR